MWMIQVLRIYENLLDIFVLSGIIIHELEVANLETKVQQYKERNFVGDYANAEVHVHDISKIK